MSASMKNVQESHQAPWAEGCKYHKTVHDKHLCCANAMKTYFTLAANFKVLLTTHSMIFINEKMPFLCSALQKYLYLHETCGNFEV